MADHFGVAPAIQLIDPTRINVVAKAHFRKPVCCCEGLYDCMLKHIDARRYMYALENGLETNYPVMPYCPCITPNCCCPIYDCVLKQYFDMGLWDKQDCLWGVGFFKGSGFFFANNRKFVCCCSDCNECCNGYLEGCCWTSVCGDRLRFQKAEWCCFCMQMKAGWCSNACGLFGLKDGEPTGAPGPCPWSMDLWCLEQGTAEDFASKINAARTAWRTRTGLE